MYRKIAFLACIVCSGYTFAQTDSATHYAVQYEGRSVKDYATGTVQINFPQCAENEIHGHSARNQFKRQRRSF